MERDAGIWYTRALLHSRHKVGYKCLSSWGAWKQDPLLPPGSSTGSEWVTPGAVDPGRWKLQQARLTLNQCHRQVASAVAGMW